LAEIGVILLMMYVGLEFRIRRVARIGARVGVAVLIEVGLMLAVGFAVATALGWSQLYGFFAAGLVAISSTAVIVKAFEEHPVDRRLKDFVFSLIVLEDLVAIVLVAVATTFARGGSLELAAVGRLLARLGLVLTVMIVVGTLVVPRVMRMVVGLGRSETTLVAAVGVTFLLALVTHGFGYSVALGAFVAGLLMSESGVAHHIAEVVKSVRDLFAAVFFVAVGMLLDVEAAVRAWPLVLAFTAVVVVGKVIGVSVGGFVTGFGSKTAVQAGLSMAQIGEFSFIIAGLGLAVGSDGPPLYSIAVTTAIITAFLTPMLVRRSDSVALWVDRRLPRSLQVFSSLYAAWLGKLGERQGESSPWRRGRRQVRLLVIDGLAVTIALIGTSLAVRSGAGLLTRFGVAPALERIAILALGAAIALPFGLGLVLAGRRLARILAESAVAPVAKGKVDQGRAPRRVLQLSLEAAITLAVGIPLVVLTLPFLPPYGAPGVIAAVLVLLGFAFWRTARDLHSHARAGAELVAHVLARQGGKTSPGGFDRVRAMLPGLGDFEPIEIEARSEADGRTLGELNLRGRTGATIVALSREGHRFTFPTAEQRLAAGDLIAVTGSHRAITAARRLATATDTSSPPIDTVATDRRDGPPSSDSGSG
jgi:CPA2 family monovalent cation:H+ antiporter-2